MTEYMTLADLIKDWGELPDYLKFEAIESKGDKMYESIYRDSLKRLEEAKSTRDIMRRFCSKHNKEDWTWENFQKEFGDFIEENDFHSYDFKREMGLIEKGVYKIYDPDAVSGTDVNNADSRPAFDPNDVNADPIMISLYKALIFANNKTDNVAQSVADKYDGLFETARNVASGASLNPHAFICGEAGVGKCASYDTVIPIRVEDIVAEEIAQWLELSINSCNNELNIQIGQFFDFLKDNYNIDFEYDKFVNLPFKVEVKDENDKWVNVSNLVKKQDALYKTTFDNGVSIKTAAKHIISFSPKLDLHKYTEDVIVGDRLDYLNTSVVENKKVSENEDVFGFQVDTDTHLYKDANGIIHHNTHTVEAGIKKGLEEWKPNKKHKHKPQLVARSGSVGTSFTDLLIFFFQNRHEKLILLDDADGFLVGTSQDIANFMKVLLNSTLKPIASPNQVRKNANRDLAKENESIGHVGIKVDTSKLLEGKCSVVCGNENFEFDINIQEAAKLKHTFGFKKRLTENKEYTPLNQIDKYIEKDLGLLAESELTDDEKEKLEAMEQAAEDMGLSNEELDTENQIPDTWIFDSNLILISNLYVSDVDEAVISRCDTYQLNLTVPEFFCRAEQILDELKVGEYSSTNPEVIKWAKRESFAILKIAVLGSKGFKNTFIPVNVHLDFRFVGNKVANKFLSWALRYQRENNIDLDNPQNWPKIEAGVRDGFMRDLIKLLAGEEKHK